MSHSLVHALVAHKVCDVLFGRYAQAIDVMATTILEEFQGISSTIGTCRVAKRSLQTNSQTPVPPTNLDSTLRRDLKNKRLFQNVSSRKLVANASWVQLFVGATSDLETSSCAHSSWNLGVPTFSMDSSCWAWPCVKSSEIPRHIFLTFVLH